MAKSDKTYTDHLVPVLTTVMIVGNVGKDPDFNEGVGKNNTPKTEFSVAVNMYNFSDKKPETVWVKVTSWGKQAERDADFIRSGNKVAVIGNLGLTVREEDGEVYWKMNAVSVQYLSKKEDNENGSSSRGSDDGKPKRRESKKPEPEEEREEVEINNADDIDSFFDEED